MNEQNNNSQEVLELEPIEYKDFTEESRVYFRKIKRKLIISLSSLIVIGVSFPFRKYTDFDIVLGSRLFSALLLITILITVYVIISLLKRNDKLHILKIKNELRKINEMYDIVAIIPVFIAVVTFLNSFFLYPASVVKTSMEPNFYENDKILVYHFEVNYDRFDVVILKITDEYYIKRIIGLPGDTITLDNGNVYVNGEYLNDDMYVKPGSLTYCGVGSSYDASDECTWTVPEGSYFVMGDNRQNSIDSRSFPDHIDYDSNYVSEENFYGKVVLKLDFLK